MDSANKFFNDFSNNIKTNINAAKIGKIVEYNPETMSATVIPLPTEENEIILNVPVATIRSKDFIVYYPLKPDDIVILLFIDNDTDNILLGEDSVQTERSHDVSDCICIGGITLLKDTLDIDDTDSLVLQNIDNTAAVTIKKNGDIDIKAKHFKVQADRIDLN